MFKVNIRDSHWSLNGQQTKALKTSFYKIIAALDRGAEINAKLLQHHSFITEHEDLVTRVCSMRQKKLVTCNVARQMSPLVLDTICPERLTWGRRPTRPQRECRGRDWQSLQIPRLDCPLGGSSQNRSPTPERWSPRRPRSARCAAVCRRVSELRAGCPPLFEIAPTPEERDWFLKWKAGGRRSGLVEETCARNTRITSEVKYLRTLSFQTEQKTSLSYKFWFCCPSHLRKRWAAALRKHLTLWQHERQWVGAIFRAFGVESIPHFSRMRVDTWPLGH